jgi:hypothetical protein
MFGCLRSALSGGIRLLQAIGPAGTAAEHVIQEAAGMLREL